MGPLLTRGMRPPAKAWGIWMGLRIVGHVASSTQTGTGKEPPKEAFRFAQRRAHCLASLNKRRIHSCDQHIFLRQTHEPSVAPGTDSTIVEDGVVTCQVPVNGAGDAGKVLA